MDLIEILKQEEDKLREKIESVIYGDSSYSNGEYLDEISEIDFNWEAANVDNNSVQLETTVYMNVGVDTEDKIIHPEDVTINVTINQFASNDFKISDVETINTSF